MFFEGIAPAATAPVSVRLDLAADYNKKIPKCKDNLIEGTNSATIGSEVLYGLMPADKAAEFQARYSNAKTPLEKAVVIADMSKYTWSIRYNNARNYYIIGTGGNPSAGDAFDISMGYLIGSQISYAVDKSIKGVGNASKGSGNAYNPINKGPLPDKVANTFRSGTYTEVVTQGDTTLYRVYGGKAGELGPYWTTTKPQGPLQSVIDSALDQNWGNTATNVTTIKVPQGTTIYQGYAASQGGLVGGGTQVYISEVNPSWIVK